LRASTLTSGVFETLVRYVTQGACGREGHGVAYGTADGVRRLVCAALRAGVDHIGISMDDGMRHARAKAPSHSGFDAKADAPH
jgi:hypothetical protein